MANIQNWLDKIKNAIYGREMRQALHDSIEAVNDELALTTSQTLTLKTNLDAEIINRQDADDALGRGLDIEIINRRNVDTILRQALEDEIRERQSIDVSLRQAIDDEMSERKTTDEKLRQDVTKLQETAHGHSNKSVLDEISEEQVSSWNLMGSNGTYIMELIGSLMTDVSQLQSALGLVVYDGGLFEQECNGDVLDGGDFNSEPSPVFDCGGFEPIVISTGSIESSVNGGQY